MTTEERQRVLNDLKARSHRNNKRQFINRRAVSTASIINKFNTRETALMSATISSDMKTYFVQQGMPISYTTYQQAYQFISETTECCITLRIKTASGTLVSKAAVVELYYAYDIPVIKMTEN